jgi:hypothetical protein
MLALLALVTFVARGASVRSFYLNPKPAVSAGCPARVVFTGYIETDGPLQVTYQWLRSDGPHAEKILNFVRASRQNISATWSVKKTMSGWVQLAIVSPQRFQTAKSAFSVNCGKK